MYQPRTGGFNAVDPVYAGLFDPQLWNRYTYTRNAPTILTDATGRNPVWAALAFVNILYTADAARRPSMVDGSLQRIAPE
jgi:hypothetical protein